MFSIILSNVGLLTLKNEKSPHRTVIGMNADDSKWNKINPWYNVTMYIQVTDKWKNTTEIIAAKNKNKNQELKKVCGKRYCMISVGFIISKASKYSQVLKYQTLEQFH